MDDGELNSGPSACVAKYRLSNLNFLVKLEECSINCTRFLLCIRYFVFLVCYLPTFLKNCTKSIFFLQLTFLLL